MEVQVLRRYLLLCLLAVLLIPTSSNIDPATDYCKAECGLNHVACKYRDEMSPRCREPKSLVDITSQKALILSLHNSFRNTIAGGQNRFEPASRMGEMAWDNELEYLSQIKVKQCFLFNNTCYSTDRFPQPGANGVLMRWWHENNYTDAELIESRIQEWFQLSEYADPKIVHSYPDVDPEPHIGFFAHTILDDNNRIGCAAMRYMSGDGRKTFLMNCLYANTMEEGQPLYAVGAPASACESERSTKYTNLCSIYEEYSYSSYYY